MALSPFTSNDAPALLPITEAHKSCCIPFTNAVASYIVDNNAKWTVAGVPNTVITRYNTAFLRFTTWAKTIRVRVRVTPHAEATNVFQVMQNGEPFSTFECARDGIERDIPVNGLTPGATIEIWEPSQNNPTDGNYNGGVDIPKLNGYITGLWLPPSQPAPAPATCSVGILVRGTSITCYSTNGVPDCLFGPIGQMRYLAHKQGKLVFDRGCGASTFCGDGWSAAQAAADDYRAYLSMGSPATFKVYIDDTRNDWAYYGAHGVLTTPTNWATFAAAYRTALLALIPTATFFVNTTIHQTSEVDHGGGTLPAYRIAVAGLTGWTVITEPMTSITDAMLPDGVHLNNTGVAQYGNGPSSNGVNYALGLL